MQPCEWYEPDRPVDVLQRSLAKILKREAGLASDLLKSVTREAHAAWFALVLDPRSDIDAVAKNVALVNDDFPNVDADPKRDFLGRVDVPFRHLALHRHRACHRVNGAGELNQHAVTGGLDDAALMGYR